MSRLRSFVDHLDAFDILAALGLVLITAGAALVYVPAALIVAGVAFVAFAYWGSEPAPPQREEPES